MVKRHYPQGHLKEIKSGVNGQEGSVKLAHKLPEVM